MLRRCQAAVSHQRKAEEEGLDQPVGHRSGELYFTDKLYTVGWDTVGGT